jgi:hypothetical protein
LDLVRCVAAHRPVRMRRNAIRTSKEAARPRRPPSRLPHLFGQGGRDRALIALAVNGPMHVRALGRAIGSDPHKTWDMVERLIDAGLVVKRDRTGGRKYVGLNRGLQSYLPLLRLLLALDRHWPAVRVQQPRQRWAMPYDDDVPEERLDHVFQSPVRSRTLLFVAALGVTDMRTLYDSLGLGRVSALYAVNHWEREGVVRSRTNGRHRLVRLDPDFVVADELRAFLESLVGNTEEYQALAAAAMPHIEAISKGDQDR